MAKTQRQIDILNLLYEKKISAEQAYDIYENIKDKNTNNFQQILCLTNDELFAYAQGAEFDEISIWRYRGWPNVCQKCKHKIDIDKSHWTIVSKKNQKTKLFHVICLIGSYCCKNMESHLNYKCMQHPNLYDCPDNIVVYQANIDEYGIIIHDGADSVIRICFCPWCGKKL